MSSSPQLSTKQTKGVVAVILVAGHQTRLEKELKEDRSGRFKGIVGVPKALLPTKFSKNVLDCW
jgi:hypothetical protein